MLAHYCGEKALMEAFANNRDVHRLVAAELNHVPEEQVTPEMRAIAKTVNFGIIYGQTGFGLSQVLKIPQEQANAYITAYRRRFPRDRTVHARVHSAGDALHGYVTTILGRRRAHSGHQLADPVPPPVRPAGGAEFGDPGLAPRI